MHIIFLLLSPLLYHFFYVFGGEGVPPSKLHGVSGGWAAIRFEGYFDFHYYHYFAIPTTITISLLQLIVILIVVVIAIVKVMVMVTARVMVVVMVMAIVIVLVIAIVINGKSNTIFGDQVAVRVHFFYSFWKWLL